MIECAKIEKKLLFSQKKLTMKILVLSERDDCCGPMAAAFLSDYGTGEEVVSAGRHPSATLNPLVTLAMQECLIDLGGYAPRDVAAIDVSSFDAVYECPDFPCPATFDALRDLRDYIKNESFLFYRSL